MVSRLETDINQLRAVLEKGLESDSPKETFVDAITALNKIPISIDLLRKTKIGQTLQDVKKKHTDGDVVSITKTLISKWKRDCDSGSSTSSSSDAVKKVNSDEPTADTSQEKSPRTANEDDIINDTLFDQLTPLRRKVFVSTRYSVLGNRVPE